MADFSRLPYYLSDGSTINAQPPTPNLAEAAFARQLGCATPSDFRAPAGLHLHWALPDALTNGSNHDGETRFPPVPNRWLVRRLDAGGRLQKSWVVESDFLHPLSDLGKPTYLNPPKDSDGNAITAWPLGKPITFPTRRVQFANGKPGPAYRYMGRALLLSDWLSEPGSGRDYLNQAAYSDYKLTALGYGEPAFAAYYPNCCSIFGFCDVDPSLEPEKSYEYEVIGWFNEPELDPLLGPVFTSLRNDADKYNRLATEFQWIVSEEGRKQDFPTRIVLYASLTVTPQTAGPWSSHGSVKIAVGNTGTEALAALLATQLSDGQSNLKAMVEDQIEALNIASLLQATQIDYRANFDKARHERGFVAVEPGDLWAVSAAEAARDSSPPQLPDAVAHALDQLNAAQEAYNSLWQDIAELRS